MLLIIGLGNPGKEYEKTRHNVGFVVLDKLMADLEFDDWVNNKKFHAEMAEGKIGKEKILLLKPQTFMNNSGQAVTPAAKFYKIKPTDIWVIHDDLDLPLGKIKIQRDRSAAGHNGVQSIIDLLGTQDFIRFRIGIASAKSTKKFGADFVLSKFSLAEDTIFKKTLATIVEAIKFAIDERIEKAMTKYN
ncbi:MAG TPA: aminoacyl-tRNA hydrolase [Candidatus Magasanikbacteria bacterium]|uniref:Peptidyl-tRNA hydrolase n=2 Tax=Candidatus Magasanikiibacteriota TaxID=1752731 RepID=A0A0G0WL32_9BACT|nr:MAG: Peptidyl-tRNA hydrolase [Candidatus Magasanikbacteria bacterium GW2011_GWC2_41_17]KKS13524.1 MAG: Peptidyl-tRNA hydrolase [Candidatus Magasanikbacteria bacterium GW2011_GWA2_41_55]HBV57855.1 aminoacyl-tRNA hydrolase [Candidatus Magasanikbacteria bacterium]HBX16267.1 aminoacyl-tRNA hydrolase [Candidatus Magasanikbacteria bacterium]